MRRRLVSAWISTVVSLSLVLLLVGVGTLLVVNAREVGNYFKENLQINVLLKEQVTEEEALSYESKVAAIPGVRATRYISREQGKEEMARLLGEDFLSVFESAPVPISIDVNLEAGYVSKDSLEENPCRTLPHPYHPHNSPSASDTLRSHNQDIPGSALCRGKTNHRHLQADRDI